MFNNVHSNPRLWVGHCNPSETTTQYLHRNCNTTFIGPGPGSGFSKTDFKSTINEWGTKQTTAQWDKLEGHVHSKLFLKWNTKSATHNIRVTRTNISNLCGALTGHSPCNYMLNKIGIQPHLSVDSVKWNRKGLST